MRFSSSPVAFYFNEWMIDKETKEKEKLSSEKVVCPQSVLGNADKCLICKLENAREELKCCSRPVHSECLMNWKSKTPESEPIKCLHCQKIIQQDEY